MPRVELSAAAVEDLVALVDTHGLPADRRWMLLAYAYVEPEDRVVVVTIQDGRTSTAPRAVG